MFAEAALEAGIPRYEKIRVSVVPLHKNGRSPQDTAACFPAAKAAIDGLVDAGIIEDDTPDILTRIDFHAPLVDGVDGLRIVVWSA
jgi:hypothetical protein